MKLIVIGQKSISKKCKCCDRHWFSIPKQARKWIDQGKFLGYLWECRCKSTLFSNKWN